jgi:hypothetical protein
MKTKEVRFQLWRGTTPEPHSTYVSPGGFRFSICQTQRHISTKGPIRFSSDLLSVVEARFQRL